MLTNKLTKCLRWVTCASLTLAVTLLVLRTWNWPLVNDASQLHYLCFLLDHGMTPYRDLLEMNMPGAYLINWAVMHTLGGGAVAWRVFDLSLMLGAAAAMIAIAWPADWLGGVLGAAVFMLYHGRDGAGQQGQRDLAIAVLLLAAYAFLFLSLRKRKVWPMAAFGICTGIAATIKPTPLPFAILLLVAAAFELRRHGQAVLAPLFAGLAGICLPLGILVLVLLREHALGAFWEVVRQDLPYYAGLGRNSVGYLLTWWMSNSVIALAALAAAITVVRKEWCHFEGAALLGGVAFGAASYFAQGKGFPYHRYPFLAFLMLWAGLEITRALRERGWVRVLGYAGLGFAAFVLPFLYVARASRIEWRQDFIHSLEGDLNALGGAGLSGHVQCLYTIAECDTTLYRMQLVQSTGLFYDFLIFGPQQNPVIQENREKFWQELQRNPPQVFIVGAELYPRGPENFGKLDLWPDFERFLRDNYRVYDQRRFQPGEPGPLDYRIYVAKQGPEIWARNHLPRRPAERLLAVSSRSE
jgi:hypothetical protein